MLQRVATRGIVFGKGKIVHDGDIQTAGTVYEELVNYRRETKEQQDDPNSNRNQNATIVDVKLLDHNATEQDEFETGCNQQLRVTLNCKQSIKNARVIVALNSPTNGIVSAVSSAYQNIQLDLQAGTNVITLNIRNLPLLIGSFSFNISLYGPGTSDFYHRLLSQAPFRIVGPPINTDGRGIRGMMKIEHDLSLIHI